MEVYSDDSALDAAMFDAFTSGGGGGSRSGGGGENGGCLGCLGVILVLALTAGIGKLYKSCTTAHDHTDYNKESVSPFLETEFDYSDFPELDSVSNDVDMSGASRYEFSPSASRYSPSHSYYGSYDDDEYDEDGYDEDGYDSEGYDRNGYDRDGYDRDGYDEEGYDDWGIDEDGYDEDGNYTNDW